MRYFVPYLNKWMIVRLPTPFQGVLCQRSDVIATPLLQHMPPLRNGVGRTASRRYH
jgi:hypothetical protein